MRRRARSERGLFRQSSEHRKVLSSCLSLASLPTTLDGGADPKINAALAYAINSAKRAQVSKEAIEKAIAKGQGKSISGAALDNVLIEAMLPFGVAAIMEGSTENKNRILADIKSIVQRAGGALTPTTFLFEKKGKIWFKQHENIGVDEAMDEAIEAGAEEIVSDEGQVVVETAPELLSLVGQRMQSALGLEVDRSQIMYDPREETLAKLDESQAMELQPVLDQLEELDDLQEVYINAVT